MQPNYRQHNHLLIALAAFSFLVFSLNPPGILIPRLYGQSATPERSDSYHASDRERRRAQFEKTFDPVDQNQPLKSKINFAKKVLNKVNRPHHSSIEAYAYRQLRKLLKEHRKQPQALELLIKTVNRQQQLHGYSQSRQDMLMELFRQLGQISENQRKRLNIVRRMFQHLHKDAHAAVAEQEWDRSLSNYRRIKKLSSGFDHFYQGKPASRMISRIKKRMTFERQTAQLIQSSSTSSGDPSETRSAGRNLIQLGRWSHALMYLKDANQNGLSTPLLDLARIGLTYQISPFSSPDIQYKYLMKMDTILEQSPDDVSLYRAIDTGVRMFQDLQQNKDDLSEQQNQKADSVLGNLQNLINESGPVHFLNLGVSRPLYFLYPTKNLLLYAPGNGNAKDYSENHHDGNTRFGSLVNPGTGIRGAFQFTGAPGRQKNVVVFQNLKHGNLEENFTIAFRFKRNRFNPRSNAKNIGNMMLGIDGQLKIGTSRKAIQIYINTRKNQDTVHAGGGIQNRNWYHLALTFDSNRSSQLRLYLNGSPIKQWNKFGGNFIVRSKTLKLGSHSRNRSPFTGCIDDVFLYDRSLSNSEIKSLYQRSPAN